MGEKVEMKCRFTAFSVMEKNLLDLCLYEVLQDPRDYELSAEEETMLDELYGELWSPHSLGEQQNE